MKISKKIYFFVILIIIIIAFYIGYKMYQTYYKKQIYDELAIVFQTKQGTAEYGDNVHTKQFVKSSNGNIISYPILNTTITGEQTIIYTIEKHNVKRDIHYQVDVKDTKAPIITLLKNEVMIVAQKGYDLRRNIKQVKDPIDGILPYCEQKKAGCYTIVSDVDTQKAGHYKITIMAMDKHHNTVKASYNLIIKRPEANELPVVKPVPANQIPDQKQIEPYYVKGVLIVNKLHGLPRWFGNTDPQAYTALQQLQKTAIQEGYEMPLISGFRSYDYQKDLYQSYVARDGQAAADRYSARPGYSEHQSGLCFDVGAIDNNYGDTAAGKWLAKHADKYGFIIRYPKGKEHITGYMYEPWHIRYVGKSLAMKVYQSGLSLEEYLGI